MYIKQKGNWSYCKVPHFVQVDKLPAASFLALAILPWFSASVALSNRVLSTDFLLNSSTCWMANRWQMLRIVLAMCFAATSHRKTRQTCFRLAFRTTYAKCLLFHKTQKETCIQHIICIRHYALQKHFC